jgi:hypothetical protein
MSSVRTALDHAPPRAKARTPFAISVLTQGTANNTLSDKPEKNKKKLESSVQDMFKNFPPASKG